MSDVRKKKKNGNFIDEAMQELSSDDPLYQFDDSKLDDKSIGFHKFDGSSESLIDSSDSESINEGESSSDDNEALDLSVDDDLEAPAGLAMGNHFQPSNNIKPADSPRLEYQPPKAPSREKPQEVASNDNEFKTNIAIPVTMESAYHRGGDSTAGEKTVVVGSGGRVHTPDVSILQAKGSAGIPSFSGPVMMSPILSGNQVVQAENLKIAQNKISEFEQELERLRAENESLSSSASYAKEQANELTEKLQRIEMDRSNTIQLLQSEIAIYKDSLTSKDFEINKLRQKVNEMETRLQKDLRKIRVRERELENRLEILKLEKDAALEALRKQNSDLSVRHDQISQESNQLKNQVTDLSQKLSLNHQQMTRAVRSLRLTLTSLEVADTSPAGAAVTPLKKAE